jgi:hypothetical protein
MPRISFDVEASVADAIRATGADIEIFGVHFDVADPETANTLVDRYRDAVSTHFNERVSAPDAAIWDQFADQANAQVEQQTRLDDVLDVLRLTIDNL